MPKTPADRSFIHALRALFLTSNHRLGLAAAGFVLLLLAACSNVPEPATPSTGTTSPTESQDRPALEAGEDGADGDQSAADGQSEDPSTDSWTYDPQRRLPNTPELLQGTLDNGFRYLIRRNTRPAQRAELWLVVNAGSLLEDEDQRGLAHYVEHMAFNGTRRFARQELTEVLEKAGMRMGSHLNASTGFDETIYTLRVPTDDPELFETAFQVLEDWSCCLSFDPEEVERERGVILEEWRLGRGAGARIRDQQIPVLFAGSRYAERLPIGQLEVLENTTREPLVRYYQQWYRPDLMALVAVGDFDPKEVEARIRRGFSSLEARPDPPVRSDFPVPDHDETRVAIVTDPEATSTGVSIYTKLPLEENPLPEGSEGRYRRTLLEQFYFRMLNSRLGEIARDADPPYLWAGTSTGSLVRGRDVLMHSVGVREGQLQRAVSALFAEVRRAELHGFTPGELERTKAEFEASYEQVYQERDKMDSGVFADELADHFLEQEAVPGIAAEVALARNLLPQVTLEEVNQVAANWGREGANASQEGANRVVLVSAPAVDAEGGDTQERGESQLPDEDQLRTVLAEAVLVQPEPWVDEVVDRPLLDRLPQPGPVVAEEHFPSLGVTHWRLANGVEVLLKPTEFKNDQILLTGFSPGGHSLAAVEDLPSAVFADTLVSRGGLGAFPQEALGKALAGKDVGLSLSIGELDETVAGGSSGDDLETMLQLLYLRFTAPRADPEAVASYLSRVESALTHRLASPGAVFQDAVSEALYGDHPRRQPPSIEMLHAIELERAMDFYRQRLADAGDFRFVMVGSFQPEQVRPLIETYLGGLPTTGREESFRDPQLPELREVRTVEVAKGLEPKTQVQLNFLGQENWSRQKTHLLGTLAEVLELHLREVLREDLGATYQVSVSGRVDDRPRPAYSLGVGFSCAPERADALVQRVFEELRAAQRGELDPSYLSKVQEAQRRSRETSLEENGFWVAILGNYWRRGLDLELILDYDSLIDGISAEDLQKAATRYLDFDRYLLALLRPEQSAAEAASAGATATADSVSASGG